MIPVQLATWGARWSIPARCMDELMAAMGVGVEAGPAPVPHPPDASEAWAASVMRLEAPHFGVWMTRNNVGALIDSRGVPVRFGLANESKDQNKVIKSADYIGIRRVTVTPAMVGFTIGQFVSREMKRPGWKFTGGEHEDAQMKWAALITRYGGDAKFATGAGSFT